MILQTVGRFDFPISTQQFLDYQLATSSMEKYHYGGLLNRFYTECGADNVAVRQDDIILIAEDGTIIIIDGETGEMTIVGGGGACWTVNEKGESSFDGSITIIWDGGTVWWESGTGNGSSWEWLGDAAIEYGWGNTESEGGAGGSNGSGPPQLSDYFNQFQQQILLHALVEINDIFDLELSIWELFLVVPLDCLIPYSEWLNDGGDENPTPSSPADCVYEYINDYLQELHEDCLNIMAEIFISTYNLNLNDSDLINIMGGYAIPCQNQDDFNQLALESYSTFRHTYLMGTYVEYVEANIDLESFISQYGYLHYLATATMFESFMDEVGEPPNDPYKWQLAMEVFYEELLPILLEFTPGIGDLIGAYNDFQDENYFWALFGIIRSNFTWR